MGSRRGGNRYKKDVAPNGFFLNCRTDHRLLKDMDGPNEHKDVKRGEAVVVYDPDGQGRYRDTLTHAASVFEPGRRWRFIGVASTQCDWNRDPSHAYADRGFVVQVGGVVSVYNESEKRIAPGDLICLQEPKVGHKCQEKGIPRQKKRFVFVPVHLAMYNKDRVVGKALSEAFQGEKFDLQMAPMF